ncbi:DUF3289 family protein [Pantoea agglomerans]|uniref:DUF3289 family protein n=1 Tax=Enterobacter agglomerans TaxID=549 RepID=UPI003BF46749
MDNYSAKDMRCGDLSESQLKTHFHLLDVSASANPCTMTKITPFTQPQSMFYSSRGERKSLPGSNASISCLINSVIYRACFRFVARTST